MRVVLVLLVLLALPATAHAECNDLALWCPSPAEKAAIITAEVVIVGIGVGSLVYTADHAITETYAWMPARVAGATFGFVEFLGGTLAIVIGEGGIDIAIGAGFVALGTFTLWAAVKARAPERGDLIPYVTGTADSATVGFVTRFW